MIDALQTSAFFAASVTEVYNRQKIIVFCYYNNKDPENNQSSLYTLWEAGWFELSTCMCT